MSDTRERVVQFGPERGLVGIQTQPTTGDVANAPHIVLLNTGVLHRVGSSRLYVDLARALAEAGVPALRFDLSGVGDSKRRIDVASVRESVERDVRDAIDYLVECHAAERVILMGLCSGAFDAFTSALSQPHVVGAYMVDMPGPFRGWAHTVRHIGARLFRPASWRNPLRSLLGHSRVLVGDRMKPEPSAVRYVVGGRGAASRARMREQLDDLLGRGMQLHFAFTAGLEENYNHASQFRSTFPRAARHPKLSWSFFPERDHSFSTRAMRERLISHAVPWVLRSTAAASGVRE